MTASSRPFSDLFYFTNHDHSEDISVQLFWNIFTFNPTVVYFFNQPFHSSFGFASLQIRYPGSESIVCHYMCEYIYLKQTEAQSACVEPANKRDVCLCIDTCVAESAKNGGYIIIYAI